MSYVFHAVDLFVFDIHTTINPQLDPKLLHKNFSFLANAEHYNDQFKLGQAVETEHFKIRPLPARTCIWNHFWKYYTAIAHESGIDYWRLQVPLVCEPTKTKLTLINGKTDFQGTIRPIIYLSSLGWSTNLELSLMGNITPDNLRDFVGKLRAPNSTPFLLESEPKSLSEVLQLFAGQLRKTVYVSNAQPVDMLKLSKYFVISIVRFTGPLNAYRSSWSSDEPEMSDTERALMHSLLIGSKVNLAEFADLEEQKKFLLTRFNGPNFALTYFEEFTGTLLFMQKKALENIYKRTSLQCLASNIRSCLDSTLMLLNFYRGSARFAESTSQISLLRNAVKITLQELPEHYHNALCRRFYLNYGPLKDLSTARHD